MPGTSHLREWPWEETFYGSWIGVSERRLRQRKQQVQKPWGGETSPLWYSTVQQGWRSSKEGRMRFIRSGGKPCLLCLCQIFALSTHHPHWSTIKCVRISGQIRSTVHATLLPNNQPWLLFYTCFALFPSVTASLILRSKNCQSITA